MPTSSRVNMITWGRESVASEAAFACCVAAPSALSCAAATPGLPAFSSAAVRAWVGGCVGGWVRGWVGAAVVVAAAAAVVVASRRAAAMVWCPQRTGPVRPGAADERQHTDRRGQPASEDDGGSPLEAQVLLRSGVFCGGPLEAVVSGRARLVDRAVRGLRLHGAHPAVAVRFATCEPAGKSTGVSTV